MTTTTIDPAAPVDVSGGLSATGTPGSAVQAYVQLVRHCPDMQYSALQDAVGKLDPALQEQTRNGITALQTVNTHLATARRHCDTWSNDILPTMFDVNADVQGYGVEYLTLIGDLKQAATDLGPSPSPADVAAYLARASDTLGAADEILTDRMTSAAALRDKLNAFVVDVSADHSAFANDGIAVQAAITGDSGLIKSLKDDVDACNTAIKHDIAMIAGGSVAIVAGIGLAIAGGVLIATGVGAPLGVGLVVGGALVAGGGIALTTVGGLDLTKKRDQLAHDQSELTVLNLAVAYFSNAEGVVAGLAGAAQQAADGAAQLAAMWDRERSKLKSVIGVLSDTVKYADQQKLTIVKALLNAAASTWTPVAQTCELIDQMLTGMKNPPNTTLYAAAA